MRELPRYSDKVPQLFATAFHAHVGQGQGQEVPGEIGHLKAGRFVLDGELVIPGQSFEALLP
jgi:hypothetical protein